MIWDFGGQQIQYMLHQFFLTSDCLYILMAEKRKELANFDYWLNILQILGKDSPVIILFNEINRDNVATFIYDEKKYNGLFPDMNLTRLDINLAEIEDGRFDTLIYKIREFLKNLPYVGQTVPARWKDIRLELEKRKSEKHISIEEYYQICEKFNITKRNDQELILNYFHLLGVVLYFKDDPQLNDTLFLDPNWTVNVVYSILSDKTIEPYNGRVEYAFIKKIWDKRGYTVGEQGKILSLMLKDAFELCYVCPTDKKYYIIPTLLPKTQPRSLNWIQDGNLTFRFQYPFMPKGIVSRLIVRLNEDIENNTVWNEGVIFQKEGAIALVVEKATTREGLKIIEIKLSGEPEKRKTLLTLIREEVKKIQKSSFPNLPYDEMVPCNCEKCGISEEPEFYRYDLLTDCINTGDYEIQCHRSRKMVKVMELIDAVLPYDEIYRTRLAGENDDRIEYHIDTKGGDLIMGDVYKVKQGFAGKNVTVQNAAFYQFSWEEIKYRIDMSKLIEELKMLKEILVKDAKTPEQYSSIIEVAKAEEAAQKKDGPKVLEFLKNAGKWALDASTKIGTAVAVEAIKKSLGY